VTAGDFAPGHLGDLDSATPVSPPENVDTSATEVMPVQDYRPIAKPPSSRGSTHFSRRVRRLTETHEIRIRTTHRRRKVLARGGVLAGFGLAMVVYPIMGNVVEYHSPVQAVPGVVVGEAPTTGHALLGDGPRLIPTVIVLPSVDDQTQALAVANEKFNTSSRLPDCQMPAAFGGENGQLSSDQLCKIWGKDNYLRADAALALAELNAQFKAKFGRDLCVGQGYRSYADQVRIKAKRGYFAASPGTSMHGWGLAIDLCRGDDRGAPKEWLDANGAAFNFENPGWAQYRLYEPWHWEYVPGVNEVKNNPDNYWDDAGAPDGGNSSTAPEKTAPATKTPVAPDPVVTPEPSPAPAPKPTTKPTPAPSPAP